MDQKEWMKDKTLEHIDMEKLQFIENLANQGSKSSPSNMLPFLMMANGQAKKNNMNFTNEEISQIITVLKKGKTTAQLERINRLLTLMNSIKK